MKENFVTFENTVGIEKIKAYMKKHNLSEADLNQFGCCKSLMQWVWNFPVLSSHKLTTLSSCFDVSICKSLPILVEFLAFHFSTNAFPN